MSVGEFKQRYTAACVSRGCEALPGITGLEEDSILLSLSSQTLASSGSLAIADALRCATFTHIELNNCYINDEGCRAIVTSLTANRHLRSLNLSGNNFGADSIECLCALLLETPTLQLLSLEWNSLGAKPTQFSRLCETLVGNRTLMTLDLRNNRISHEGAPSLARLIDGNTSLLQLDLRWNRIGGKGGELLATAVASNNILCKLSLTGNDISYATLMGIEAKIASNAKIRKETEVAQVETKKHIEIQKVMIANAERMQSEVESRDQALVKDREKIRHYGEQFDSLEAELKLMKTELHSRDHHISTLQEDHGRSRQQTEQNTEMLQSEHTNTLNALKQHHEERLERHAADMQAIEAERDMLRAQLASAQNAHTALQAEDKQRQGEVKLLQEELASTQEANTALKAQLEAESFQGKKHEMLAKRYEAELDAKAAAHTIINDRKIELENEVLDIERERNALDAQLQRIHVETERKVAKAREELHEEHTLDTGKANRKLKDAMDDLAARERIIEELRLTAIRSAEQFHKDFDEAEAEHKKTRNNAVELELETHRLGASITQMEAERKRIGAELGAAEQRRENLVKELDLTTRSHQSELDRLAERFACDRLDLERKLLQREERLAHLTAETQELSKKLAKSNDEQNAEKERLQRRVMDQVRIIFDESTPYIP